LGVIIDAILLKMDNDGEIQWTRTYGGDANDMCEDIIKLENGGIVMLCSSDSFNEDGQDYWLLRVEEDGDSLGSVINDRAEGCYIDKFAERIDGGFQIGGYYLDEEYHSFIWAEAIEIEGEEIWSRTYGDATFNDFEDLISIDDGDFILCGYTVRRFFNGLLIKINSEGGVIWSREYDMDAIARFYATIQVEDGFVCTGDLGINNYWVFKVDDDGELVWSNSYRYNNQNRGDDIIRASDGGFIIAGTDGFSINNDYDEVRGNLSLLKLNQEGEMIWRRVFDIADSHEASKKVIHCLDNSYIIFGETSLDNDRNIMVLKTTPELTLTTDVSGNGNHAEIGLSAVTDDGLWGDALDTRSEEGGYLIVQNDETLQLASFSIEGWFVMLPDLDQTGTIIKKALDVESSSYMLWVSSEEDRVGFVLTTEERTYELMYETQPDDEDWHHIAGTFENQVARLYYDHEIRSEQQIDGDVFYDDCELLIGTGIAGGLDETQFYGLIDEVRISDIDREYHFIDDSQKNANIPLRFEFHPPFPNPFNTATFVKFGLPSPGFASLSILDIRGSVVSPIKSNYFPAGEYVEKINMLSFPTGIYFIRLEYGSETLIRAVTYLK